MLRVDSSVLLEPIGSVGFFDDMDLSDAFQELTNRHLDIYIYICLSTSKPKTFGYLWINQLGQ